MQLKLSRRASAVRLIYPRVAVLIGLSLLLWGCQSAAPESEPTAVPISVAAVELQPIEDGPVLLREGITLQKIAEIGGGGIKLVPHPNADRLLYMRPGEGIFEVALTAPYATDKVVDIGDITDDGFLTGMKAGPDGSLYVVANRRPSETLTQALIYRLTISSTGSFARELVARTEPYPASNTNYDHIFNGIAISPDNEWIYLNSGSRTDHGEVQATEGAFPNIREVPLTSAIFRIPVGSTDLELPNDEAALIEAGYLFADGTRNAYDMEFAPNGDLFGIDNGPDADYSEELNWLREGHHYGFPWRFGDQDNPQQFADYEPSADNRLSDDFGAVQSGTYQNDPDFPAPPAEFTDPIINLGPDATYYRDDDGNPQNAAQRSETLATFTAHRSPLGLVFTDDAQLPAYLQSGPDRFGLFVVSWGSAGGDLPDPGEDLLYMQLTKRGDNYEAVTSQIAREFRRPIDAVMIENRLYVLEWDGAGNIWELTFN